MSLAPYIARYGSLEHLERRLLRRLCEHEQGIRAIIIKHKLAEGGVDAKPLTDAMNEDLRREAGDRSLELAAQDVRDIMKALVERGLVAANHPHRKGYMLAPAFAESEVGKEILQDIQTSGARPLPPAVEPPPLGVLTIDAGEGGFRAKVGGVGRTGRIGKKTFGTVDQAVEAADTYYKSRKGISRV